jgi:hypothetical protein
LSQNYKDMINTVEEIENSATKVEFNTIEISGIEDTAAQKHKPQFQLLLSLAMQIEGGHQKEQPKTQQEPSAQAYAKVQRPQPTKEVKDEISAFANKLDSNDTRQPIGPFEPQQEKGSEIMLQNLSISDQISELERIIDGLKGQSLDYEKKEEIKKEVYSLNKEVIEEIMKGTKKAASKTEQDLIRLRDQRLNEAVALLK